MKRFEIYLKGRVQGVGFRYFTLIKALENRITGYVRNLPDGGVFVEAEGDESDLEAFIDFLKIGPARARIDQIIIDRFETSFKSNQFIIK
jgi:acylphosphatase